MEAGKTEIAMCACINNNLERVGKEWRREQKKVETDDGERSERK